MCRTERASSPTAMESATIGRIRDLKPTLVLIVLAVVVFAALGAVMQISLDITKALPASSAYPFQGVILAVGIVVSFYCFLVSIYEEQLNDFASEEQARRRELAIEASAASSDGRGIAV